MATAQEEFNDLIASSNRNHDARHPEDRHNDVESASQDSTLAGSTTRMTLSSTAYSSIRSGATMKPSTAYDEPDQDDDDDDDDYYAGQDRVQRKPTTYYLPQNYEPDANTGPKGVIADAQAFEREKRGGRNRSYERTKDLDLPKSQRPSVDFGRPMSRMTRPRKATSSSGSDNLDDDDDDDDDDEVRRIQEERKQELSEKWRQNSNAFGQRPKGTFAGLHMVDANGYLEAVESASRGSRVVVFLFDNGERSASYARILGDIASRYPDIRVVALHYDEAEIDQAGVPGLLAYRDGEKIAGIMPLSHEVPLSRDGGEAMEEALKSHDVL